MKPNLAIIAFLTTTTFVLAQCQSSNQKNIAQQESGNAVEQMLQAADSISGDNAYRLDDPSRKIVHTADVGLRVDNVLQSTEKIEALTKQLGGIVEASKLVNDPIETRTIPVSTDSVQEVNVYRSTASLTLRVPSWQRDSLINHLPKIAYFVEHRSLEQKDESYRYLGNSLKNQSSATVAKSATKKAKSTQDVLLTNNDDFGSIDRKLDNLDLMDKVNYATVTVELHQPAQAKVQTMVNIETFAKPSFHQAAATSLSTGWQLFLNIVLGLLSIWPITAIALLLMVFRKRIFKSSNPQSIFGR